MQIAKLYVGNLNYTTTSEQLEELFANYGTVKQVNIIGNKGFGFVEMSTVKEAEAAQEALNDREFMGRTLRVNEAYPPKNSQRRNQNEVE